jgi:DUF917 family protein
MMPVPSRAITVEDLEAFAIGASILETGGDVDLYRRRRAERHSAQLLAGQQPARPSGS